MCIRKAFLLIYDFATAPLWISLYMRKILFSFLSVYIAYILSSHHKARYKLKVWYYSTFGAYVKTIPGFINIPLADLL